MNDLKAISSLKLPIYAIEQEKKSCSPEIKTYKDISHQFSTLSFEVSAHKKISDYLINNDPLAMKRIIDIQSRIRGWRIRNETFLPHHLLGFQNSLVGFSSEIKQDITRLICIELKRMSSEFLDRARLSPSLKAYRFVKPGEKVKLIDCPFTLYLKVNREKNCVNLLIIPDKNYTSFGKPLDQGNNKEIYRAQKFVLSSALINDRRDVSHSYKVVLLPDYDSDLEEGIYIQKEILEKVKGKFVELPKKLRPVGDKFKYCQAWYNGNLNHAIKSHFIPLDYTSNCKKLPFTMKNIIDVFVDVARSLEDLHEKGYVHRDVKTSNILLKLNEKNEPEGYLCDFDFTQKMGTSDEWQPYRYWDFLSRRGLVFPSTDNYALVISLGEALIPRFNTKGIGDEPEILLREDIFNHFQSKAIIEHVNNAFEAMTDTPADILKQMLLNNIPLNEDEKKKSLPAGHFRLLQKLKVELEIIIKTLNLVKNLVKKHDMLASNFNFEMGKMFTTMHSQSFYENILRPQLGSSSEIRKEIEVLQTMMNLF